MVIASAAADQAESLTSLGCPELEQAIGSALIGIRGKVFEGRAAAVPEAGAAGLIAIGEPGGRCIAFAPLDPAAIIRAGEHNVVSRPDTPPPANTRAPLLLASVLDPPVAPRLATRGTLHVTEDEGGMAASFRLELHHGDVPFTLMGRFAIAAPE